MTNESSTKTIAINVQHYAVGTTYFIDYEDYYNPWKIWTEHLHNSVQSDLKRLESQEERRLLGSFHDEKYFYRKIHNRMYGALHVAIYSEVEIALNEILDLTNYKNECFECKLKQLNIKAKDIPCFDNVNILRLKVNAFKHNNMIMTKQLAKELGEKDLKLIDYTQTDIGELVKQCGKFLFELEKNIKNFKESN